MNDNTPASPSDKIAKKLEHDFVPIFFHALTGASFVHAGLCI